MARGKGTELATVDGAQNGQIAEKTTITKSAAADMVRQLAAQKFREAKAASKAKRDQLVQRVGSVDRIDESVVADAERLMTRIALIARTKSDRYASGGNAALEAIVKKVGGVVGDLRAFMLTNASIGLFESIEENDYRAQVFARAGDPVDPLRYAGAKVREAAETLLERYEVIDDPKPAKKKGGKNAAPEHPAGVCRICGCTAENPCNVDCDVPDVDSDVCGSCVCMLCGTVGKTKEYDGELLCENCAPLDDGEGEE